MKFCFLQTCKLHSFSFQMILKSCKSAYGFKNSPGYRREFHSEKLGWENLVSHTAVLQQSQFKMPETVIKHHIWPSKVRFSNRRMPEAPDFDENRKPIFLTRRSKIVVICIVTEYQRDSFRAVGSLFVSSPNFLGFVAVAVCLFVYLFLHQVLKS